MTCLAGLFLLSLSTEWAAKQWSLRDCIDYALANNIQFDILGKYIARLQQLK